MSFFRRFLNKRELAILKKKEDALAIREKELQERIDALKKFKLVHTQTVDAWYKDNYGSKHDFKVTYMFFESRYGERYVEIKTTYRGDQDKSNDDLIKQYAHFDNWSNEIVPWIKGRMDPTIPSYFQAESNDVVAELAGKRIT